MHDKNQAAPELVLKQWRQGKSYKSDIGLYEDVDRAEKFYIGKQWEGVKAPDLDKPVFNSLKRVVSFFVANIVSDNFGVRLELFGKPAAADPEAAMAAGMSRPNEVILQAGDLGSNLTEVLHTQIREAMELMDLGSLFRWMLRDSAVDGDGCLHFYFDPDADPQGLAETGSTPGVICAEVLENTAVHFGSHRELLPQKQPYIIVEYRQSTEEVRERAKANGSGEWEDIQPDADDAWKAAKGMGEECETTVLRKYWKVDGERGKKRVMCVELTSGGQLVRKETDTGLSLYPVIWMPWERVKRQYHGASAVVSQIPNQIFVNKAMAMAMQSVKLNAFPKTLFDKTKLPKWSNRLGEALGVNGDPRAAVATAYRPGEMSAQVMQMVQSTMSMTQETMGASDAALGNINPENTSAIIAVQQATAMPLTLQRMEYHRCVEETVRILLDIMRQNYGIRLVEARIPGELADAMRMAGEMPATEEERTETVRFDFNSLSAVNMRLNVDIGQASYWSELSELQTLQNLREAQILDDEEYLKRIPEGYIQNKQELLDKLKQKQAQAAEAQAQAAQLPAEMPMMGGAADALPGLPL